jgi:hypothetical protein
MDASHELRIANALSEHCGFFQQHLLVEVLHGAFSISVCELPPSTFDMVDRCRWRYKQNVSISPGPSTKEPNRKIVQIDARADILVRSGVYKALALVGAALFAAGGFLAAADWSDYWMHDCYTLGGCSSIAFPTMSAVRYITPWVLTALLGLALVSVGLKSLSGVTRTQYIVWSVLVGLVVLIGLYSYVLFPWAVPPPSGTSTSTSTTTVG